jgi:lysine-specific demethylase 3
MMLTQIIAGDALDEVSSKLKVLAKLSRSNGFAVNGWEKPDRNGANKEDMDIKADKLDEDDDDSSTLRDLLSSHKENGDSDDFSWNLPDIERKKMTLAESRLMYPNVSHSWICDGEVLHLHNGKDKDMKGLFKFIWKRSQPVIISSLHQFLNSKLWTAEAFADLPEQNGDSSNPESCVISHGQTLKKFFDGFDNESKRPVGENGDTLLLRLKENWPSQEDEFLNMIPNHYKDLMVNLPLSDYTDREGILNLACRLPDCFVRLDLGPRLWGGYAKTIYNMQYNVSDAIHVMVTTSQTKDSKHNIMEVLESSGCDQGSLKRVRDNPGQAGAIWHVFHPSDADRIKEFINSNTKSDPKLKSKDPLYDQSMFLKDRMLEKLGEEEGITPWTFCQMVGDGVMIPAGAPYQVILVNSALLVQSEFVSPEHMAQSVQLSHADVQQFDDRLQVKNLVFHSCKDALSVLEKPDTKKEEK